LQEIIDRQTEPWGVKVTAVEVKDVALPDTMKRAMAKQAEAERERRAKIVNAEGEFQAAEKMVQAAGDDEQGADCAATAFPANDAREFPASITRRRFFQFRSICSRHSKRANRPRSEPHAATLTGISS
jgi:hypothetical protein